MIKCTLSYFDVFLASDDRANRIKQKVSHTPGISCNLCFSICKSISVIVTTKSGTLPEGFTGVSKTLFNNFLWSPTHGLSAFRLFGMWFSSDRLSFWYIFNFSLQFPSHLISFYSFISSIRGLTETSELKTKGLPAVAGLTPSHPFPSTHASACPLLSSLTWVLVTGKAEPHLLLHMQGCFLNLYLLRAGWLSSSALFQEHPVTHLPNFL